MGTTSTISPHKPCAVGRCRTPVRQRGRAARLGLPIRTARPSTTHRPSPRPAAEGHAPSACLEIESLRKLRAMLSRLQCTRLPAPIRQRIADMLHDRSKPPRSCCSPRNQRCSVGSSVPPCPSAPLPRGSVLRSVFHAPRLRATASPRLPRRTVRTFTIGNQGAIATLRGGHGS